jgi:hypothetical protein
MVRIELSDDKEFIRELAKNPEIFHKTYGIGYTPGAYTHAGAANVIAYNDDKVMAVLNVDKFSEVSCFIHGFVMPEYCTSKNLEYIGKKMLELFKEKTDLIKIIAAVPKTAIHAIRWLQKVGFTLEAVLANAAVYANQVTDSLLLTYEIKR